MAAEMQWIKLRIDMFDDEKIKLIQSMPEGDAILVVWIRLIALAGKCNADGLVLVEDEFPYTDEMLAVIFNKPLQIVKLALNTFEKFRMVESTIKGIYITNFDKHQNINGMDRIREQGRIRKQRERERKKALLLEVTDKTIGVTNEVTGTPRDKACNVTSEVAGMSRDMSREVTHLDIEEEYKEISSKEDIKKNRVSSVQMDLPKEPIAYRQIIDDYNAVCVDLPPLSALSVEGKRKIRTLMNGMDKDRIMSGKSVYERLHCIFQMTHDSDFLSGRDGRWTASFDWLINKANALKVLEGTYANKVSGTHLAEKKQTNRFCDFPQRSYDCRKIEEQLLGKGMPAMKGDISYGSE